MRTLKRFTVDAKQNNGTTHRAKRERYFEVMTVTPAMAAEWLENKNERNRPLKKALVAFYARQMTEGRWRITTEGVVFDWYGNLLNGQHRLSACVMADVPFDTIVWFNEDPDAFGAYDIGSKRTTGDILALTGEKDANNLAAACAHIFQYERGQFLSSTATHRPVPEEVRETLGAHPGLRESVAKVGRIKFLAPPSLMVALHYLFARIDPPLADEFFEQLRSPDGLSARHPINILRNRLIANRLPNAKAKLVSKEIAALTIKAWNKLRDGDEDIGALRWRTTGRTPEEFPQIR